MGDHPDVMYEKMTVIERVFATIQARRDAEATQSYVAHLFKLGKAGIAIKVGEEAVETVVAALASERDALIHESTDLLFHLMVLWAETGVTPDEVFTELARREGVSGLEEKASRETS